MPRMSLSLAVKPRRSRDIFRGDSRSYGHQAAEPHRGGRNEARVRRPQFLKSNQSPAAPRAPRLPDPRRAQSAVELGRCADRADARVAWRMAPGRNHALSKTRSVVEASTSASTLPMTPATTSGRSASAMTRICRGVEGARSLPSRVVIFLAGIGRAYNDLGTADFLGIKGTQRLAEFKHDPVGYVHDIVDGAESERSFQVALEPGWTSGRFSRPEWRRPRNRGSPAR